MKKLGLLLFIAVSLQACSQAQPVPPVQVAPPPDKNVAVYAELPEGHDAAQEIGIDIEDFSKKDELFDIENNYSEAYKSIILNEKYGKDITYVIGHKSPDSDAVGSAIAYANLLNELGIEAKAVTAGRINNETRFALNYYGMEEPEILTDATGKQFVLTDHSTYTHSIDGMRDARIVGIVDHHGIGDATNTELIFVRSLPVGAACTNVYMAYKECGVEITRDMARVMLMGIISDTSNGTSSMTEMDYKAYNELKELAEIDDFDALAKGMADGLLNYDGMRPIDIYKNDYKEYEAGGHTFAIGIANVDNEKDMYDRADEMRKAMEEHYDEIGMDMLFGMIKNKPQDQMLMVCYGDGATEVMEECFHNYDGEKYFVFDENVSRKKKIVPPIMKALEEAASSESSK
ncbi:manganese-dependent inorganic pyrophosphatase [Oribacterium sp. KHPX15]|uniref:DHH family phosphoesterase n=1 Tax=Oribacterium sp. KHPX15 TaxID=1855342 RepID=UPI00089651FC|nr:DHHA2 domain-containing protein [Oribacterium sp. KHPX15]SEA66263.1 manganese-dependent inorganic pyrophosphatase [Oribacterium sp. KHPX15]